MTGNKKSRIGFTENVETRAVLARFWYAAWQLLASCQAMTWAGPIWVLCCSWLRERERILVSETYWTVVGNLEEQE